MDTGWEGQLDQGGEGGYDVQLKVIVNHQRSWLMVAAHKYKSKEYVTVGLPMTDNVAYTVISMPVIEVLVLIITHPSFG